MIDVEEYCLGQTGLLLLLCLILAAASFKWMRVRQRQDDLLSDRLSAGILWILIMAGVAARFWMFASWPASWNQDEAMHFVNAVHLLETGRIWLAVPSPEESFFHPTVFCAWGEGNGQYPLLAYLSLPFLKLFGYTFAAFRLPMLILSAIGLLSLAYVAYAWKGRRLALVTVSLLLIAPFHVQMSRFALDCYAYVNVMLLALALFCHGLGTKKVRYLYGAMALLGLSMYGWGLSLFSAPAIACFLLIWLAKYRLIETRHVMGLTLAYGTVSFPFFLYILINYFNWPSIELPWCTIPNIGGNRSTEFVFLMSDREQWLVFKGFVKTWIGMVMQYPTESGGMAGNIRCGCLYPLTIAPFLLGCVLCCANLVKRCGEEGNGRQSFFPALTLFLLLLFSFQGVILEPGLLRLQGFWYVQALAAAFGLFWIWARMPRLFVALALCYAAAFGLFLSFFFGTDYFERHIFQSDQYEQYQRELKDPGIPRRSIFIIREAYTIMREGKSDTDRIRQYNQERQERIEKRRLQKESESSRQLSSPSSS